MNDSQQRESFSLTFRYHASKVDGVYSSTSYHLVLVGDQKKWKWAVILQEPLGPPWPTTPKVRSLFMLLSHQDNSWRRETKQKKMKQNWFLSKCSAVPTLKQNFLELYTESRSSWIINLNFNSTFIQIQKKIFFYNSTQLWDFKDS